MIFQLPEVFQGIGYYQGISFILWIIVIILLFISAILFLIHSFKKELEMAKKGYTAYVLFFIFFGITRIVYLLSVYIPENYEFFTTIGYISAIASLIFILYVLETHVVKSTKRIFTYITIFAFVITTLALLGLTDRYTALDIIMVLTLFSIAAILSLYLYLIIKATGKIRKKAILIFIGIVCIYLSETIDSEWFIEAIPSFPLEITPIIMMIGIVLFTGTQLFYSTE